jgi:hypothetical protein
MQMLEMQILAKATGPHFQVAAQQASGAQRVACIRPLDCQANSLVRAFFTEILV